MEIAESIATAYNGQEGLEYLKEHCSKSKIKKGSCPDLIIIDNKMPVMDGFEFLDALDEVEGIDRSRIHIAMLSTSVDIKDVEKAASYGKKLVAYITKPLETKAIKQVYGKIFHEESEQKGEEE